MAESKSTQATYVTLAGTNQKMPIVGLGTWKAEKGVVGKAIISAFKAGYTHLDCAADYGNEKEVGAAIKEGIDSGLIKRENLFVTSKLWNTFHAKEHVMEACKRTLSDLGLTYLDLYLIHFPISLKYVDPSVRYPPEWTHDPKAAEPKLEFANVSYRETWEAMEGLVKAGLVKNIGVSNLNCQMLMDVLKYNTVPVAVNQVEHHPYLPMTTLVNFCQSKGIVVTGYSSFGGISYAGFSEFARSVPSLLEDAKVAKIAKKHNKSPAQVLLKWAAQRNVVVIPKSTREAILKENIQLFDFTLDEVDYVVLNSFEKNLRFNDPGAYANYPIWG